jgi:hypothetical protein
MPECCGFIQTTSVQFNYELGFLEQVPPTYFFDLVKTLRRKLE